MPANEHVFFWATVETDSPLTVRRDGETEPLGVAPSVLVDPSRLRVGDRVWCQLQHRRALVLGVAGGVPQPELVGPWLPITSIRSSWTRYSGTWSCDARKSPGGVQLSAVLKPNSSGSPGTMSSTGLMILTLPTELRPPAGTNTKNTLIYAVVFSTDELIPFRVTEDGDLINLRTWTSRASWVRLHGEVFY